MTKMSYLFAGKALISGWVNGQKFRPSNWPERMCEVGATRDPIKGIMRYSNHLNIALDDEHGYCVHVDFDALAQYQPETFKYVCWFIESNQLTLVARDASRFNAPAFEAQPPLLTALVA